MSNSIDFEKLKRQAKAYLALTQRRFEYLVQCINRFGISGVAWWAKSFKQIDEFALALDDLRSYIENNDICLTEFEKIFADFIVPDEDMGHIQWYSEAHRKLKAFEEELDKKSRFNLKKIQLAQNELKFISQANEFHQRYQLESIQQKVKTMYQELQQKISDYQQLEKEKVDLEKQKLETAQVQAEADKAEQLAKAKTMETLKVKEKRLAIIEDKKRHLAQKEAAEIELRKENELAENRAKEAERERQEKLQASYQELELSEKLKALPLEQLIEMVNNQIENKTILTFIQLDQLDKLKQTIESKKA